MKAKKVIILISISLFIVGFILAILINNVSDTKWGILWVSLSIGISTGGLVAFLIEIPSISRTIYAHKQLLQANGLYTYQFCKSFISSIDRDLRDDNKTIFEERCSHSIQQIIQFAMPLLNVDSHIFTCACKRKQINFLKWSVHNFLLHREAIDSQLKSKILKTKIQLINSSGNLYPEITTKDVKCELQEIRNNIFQFCNVITCTMGLVLSKKELQKWQIDIQNVEDAVNKEFGSV